MGLNLFIANKDTNSIPRYKIDLGNLVGGAEAIKKVHDEHPSLQGRRLSDQGKIHDLLNRIGGQEGESCDPSRHDIAVITEDGQRLRCHGARGHVKHCWSQLAGYLVHTLGTTKSSPWEAVKVVVSAPLCKAP